MNHEKSEVLLPEHLRDSLDLRDLCWNLSAFLAGLEKRGVTLADLPEDLRALGCFNTACGGMRSNGARTSLRNLVALEGMDFARTFLTSAAKGADNTEFSQNSIGNPFLAEVEWLNAMGSKASKLLDDYDQSVHLLLGVDRIFVELSRFKLHEMEWFFEDLPESVRDHLIKVDENEDGDLDRSVAVTYAYLITHMKVRFVTEDEMECQLDAIAQKLRKKKVVGGFLGKSKGLH